MGEGGKGAVMMTEGLLAQIIGRVVERCGKGDELPGEGEWRGWAGGFMGKIREMHSGG